MIERQRAVVLLFYIAALLAALGPSPLAAQQIQGEQNDLRITNVDTTGFPTVAVRVLTTSAGSAPIPDLTRLILRENGVPIPDTTTALVPVGVDVALVIDANPDLLFFDDRSGLSRRDKLAAGITRYADQFMNPAGLDRVSIITPDETGEGAAFLTRDATRPSDVAAAVNAYTPTPPRITPLQGMLEAALDHLAAGEDGRFQAVVLYTDGARINRQLDFQALVSRALDANIPIYTAILGADASPDETANVSNLYVPTRGRFVHMPEPESADPIYEILQAQGQQAQLSYESELRSSATHEVSVSIGNVRDAAPFELTLSAPEVALLGPDATVRRVGSAVDTPLALLQPAVLPLAVQVTWPDDRPRRLSQLTFRVDGTPQPQAELLSPDGSGQIPLQWDISLREAGVYRLEVEVADELGFRAAAEPLEITIEVARPSPPTPTPVPTRVPLPNLAERAGSNPLLALLPLMAVAAAVGYWLWRRSNRPPKPDEAPLPRIIPADGPPPRDGHAAVLVWGDDVAFDEENADFAPAADRIELIAADVTLGREAEAVDIVVDDPSVSRLHARIRRAAGGDYWLYDEGSAGGTFLNFERLGLAPRPLQHNDVIQLGRVMLRFRLELPSPDSDAA